jgi:putative membrane protein
MKRALPLLLLAGLTGTPALVYAHGNARATTAVVPQSVAMSDADLIAQLAEADLAQIRLARLALDKTQSPQARDLATRMLDDHTSGYQQLQTIALGKGVPFPSETAGNQKLVYQRLAKLSAASFDHAYADQVALLQHQSVIGLSDLQAHTDDPALRDFAARSLPTARRQAMDASRDLSRM